MVEYLRLGSTGIEVSQACLGTWMFGTKSPSGSEIVTEEVALSILDSAWDSGVNFIDTANVYGRGSSEEYIGKWLTGLNRRPLVLTGDDLANARRTSTVATVLQHPLPTF